MHNYHRNLRAQFEEPHCGAVEGATFKNLDQTLAALSKQILECSSGSQMREEIAPLLMRNSNLAVALLPELAYAIAEPRLSLGVLKAISGLSKDEASPINPAIALMLVSKSTQVNRARLEEFARGIGSQIAPFEVQSANQPHAETAPIERLPKLSHYVLLGMAGRPTEPTVLPHLSEVVREICAAEFSTELCTLIAMMRIKSDVGHILRATGMFAIFNLLANDKSPLGQRGHSIAIKIADGVLERDSFSIAHMHAASTKAVLAPESCAGLLTKVISLIVSKAENDSGLSEGALGICLARASRLPRSMAEDSRARSLINLDSLSSEKLLEASNALLAYAQTKKVPENLQDLPYLLMPLIQRGRSEERFNSPGDPPDEIKRAIAKSVRRLEVLLERLKSHSDANVAYASSDAMRKLSAKG